MFVSPQVLFPVLAAFATLLLPGIAKAAPLAQYTFDDGTRVASGVALDVTAGDFTNGSGNTGITLNNSVIQGVGGSKVFAMNAAQVPGSNTDPGTAQNTVDENKAFSFTIEADAGSSIDFSEISLYGWAQSGNSSDTSYQWFIRTDLTGTTTFTSPASTIRRASTTAPTTDSQFIFDLSSEAALQDVDGEVTFFVGGFKTALSASAGNFRLDSIVVSGDVQASVIPEPASLAFMALGGACLIVRRRRA